MRGSNREKKMSEKPCPTVDKEAAWKAFDAMRNYRTGRGNIRAETRLSVYEASNWRCCYCGVKLLSTTPLARETHSYYANQEGLSLRNGRSMRMRIATIEHIVRRTDGGNNSYENLAAACAWCNHSRGDFEAEVWFDQIAWLKENGSHPHYQDNICKLP